ncbi:MAG: von Willebrand factor type A domain-containing protein, partial [Acidobacteriota bacterium]
MSSLAAALVALVLLTGSSTDAEIATPPDTPVGEVSGRVLYAEDEFPSAFVLVFLESETSEWMSDALSEEDGSFVFSQVPIGRYKLYAFETGYVSNAFVGLMVPTTGRRSLELRLEISDAESQEISCDFSHLWRHLGNVHHLQERFLAPEQPFVLSSDRSRSRLPLTLDAASPPLVRELLRRDGRPNEELSRVEELINAYPGSTPIVEAFDGHAALVDVELAPCPWAPGQLLLRTSLRARPLGERPLPSRHLFVLAESTLAMGTQARWPLMRSELHRLVESLRPDDRLTLITTSDDAAQLRLDAVSGAEHETARKVIDSLTPSGHGDLETGLVALHESLGRRSREKRLRHACLFTAGLAAHEGPRAGELGWIRQARKATGVPLTVVGFEPNDWDSWWAPAVAQAGGGRYLVLDDEDASQQVLDRELGARLVTVARDARLELRCSTERVVSHRLLHGNRPLEL